MGNISRLAEVVSRFEDIDLLAAEIMESEDIETVDELTEYLEDELEYAAE